MRIIYIPGRLHDGHSVHTGLALCVSGGRVEDVGTPEELEARCPGASVRRNSDWLITPGLVDAHDHGRGVSPVGFGVADQSLELWIPRLGGIPPISPYTLALFDGLNLAASGVTTVVHCHNPVRWEDLEEELADTLRGYNDAGIRVVLCPPYVERSALVYGERERFLASLSPALQAEFAAMILDQPIPLEHYLAAVHRLLNRLRPQMEAGWADIQLCPVGGQWCGDEALLAVRDYALDKGLRVHMHLLETRYQRTWAHKQWGMGALRHYRDIGFLGPWLSCAHMVWPEEGDTALLAETGTGVVVNPSSNLRLRSGTAPLKTLLDGGVTCGLGLDGCSLDDDQDYVREMRVALLNPAQTGVNAAIPPERVLAMATANGAAITGKRLSQGILAEGVPADFVCFSRSALEYPYASPDADPIALLLQRGTRRSIDAVYCGGTCIAAQQNPLAHSLPEAADRLRAEIGDHRGTDANPQILEAIRQFYSGWEGEEPR